MSQMSLIPDHAPPLPPSTTIAVQDADTFLSRYAETWQAPTLCHVDPPWRYDNNPGKVNPEQEGIYNGLPDSEIQRHLRALHNLAAPGARLVLWVTFPKMMEFLSKPGVPVISKAAIGWRPVTGGAWVKTAQGQRPAYGTGFHWAGASELPLIYTKTGKTINDRASYLTNGCISTREDHSEKPEKWLEGMVNRWTEPGDTVLDLYAGMAPMARACVRTGRQYVGCEIDPERARVAQVRLARAGNPQLL